MKKFLSVALAVFAISASKVPASSVAVHDPSIVLAWRDGAGKTYPADDATHSRTKTYYVFGTQLGAARSTDMIDWTPFTPTFSVNGAVTKDYLQVFQAAAAWSGHTVVAKLQENLWAPDVIWNAAMQKWTLYFSVNGDAWKSSIVLLTADNIEGPYAYVGPVVFSGMTNKTTGIGNTDYQNVTGSSTVAARYLDGNGLWTGTYGTSTIDPAVTYDEQGRLWMVYGSWSGGIFLIKLDEKTGLRDNTWNYGFGTAPVSNGTTLRYDPYMGIHLGGGYYVSGEGSYIRYLKDPSGAGFYYLFVSMGFYSPEGGYTMRVFRSPTIDGTYTDATGDNAAFSKYVLNYGNNVQYGFPIMQNYKWSWWSLGEIAQGHNSVLRDDDGKAYLVYHRKLDNGTIVHNVEVHPLVFNKAGWVLAAPFEHRVGFGMRATAFAPEEIVGTYGAITHNSVDYANLASNKEVEVVLKADGTVSGGYTGTWSYEFAAGRNFLTLVTSAGTFNGVLLEQLMNDHSARTVSFTAMNPASERALWAYRKPRTLKTSTTDLSLAPKRIGATDYSLLWSDTAQFHGADATGDFVAEFLFDESSRAQENWDNWALVFRNGTASWNLRGDAFSTATFAGSTVTHKTDWNGAIDFKKAYQGKRVRLLARRTGTTIDVFAFADDVLVASATATGCPTGNTRILLGGEAVSLELLKASVGAVAERERVGTIDDDGTYPVAFNVAHSATASLTGDFKIAYRFVNHRTHTNVDNWANYVVRAAHDNTFSFLRADAYAMDMTGQVAYTYDWTWPEFLSIMAGAEVRMTITRRGATMVYDAAILSRDGRTFHCTTTNTQATTSPIAFDLTTEKGMVDLLEVETSANGPGPATVVAGAASATQGGIQAFAREGRLVLVAQRTGRATIRTLDGRQVRIVDYVAGRNVVEGLGKGMYVLDRQTFLID